MEYITTELIKVLAEGNNLREFFRQHLEKAVNKLLEHELTVFLDYEKYDPTGYNSGNSRNGFYERIINSEFGKLTVRIPRDRAGEFKHDLFSPYQETTDDLETTIIQLYKKGITTREIVDLIHNMYGHHYSAQTISNITKLVEEDVKVFHERQVKSRYVAIFCDATFISVRRDNVSREAVHVLIGIDYEGKKEVLDYNIYPTESKNNYKEMLEDLKTRGLNHVLLFVSDDLTQLEEAVLESFPMAKHQACWTHLSRNVLNKVRVKDKAEVGEDFKKIHQAKNLESALEKYNEFLEKWFNRYPKVKKALEKHDNLFTYLEFPKEIQRSI